jgi:hypothetical protein
MFSWFAIIIYWFVLSIVCGVLLGICIKRLRGHEGENGVLYTIDEDRRKRIMGEMRIMDKDAGDLKVIWDPVKQDEVDAAKAQFEALVKKGYLAFEVKKGGEKGKEIKKFDPAQEMIIMSPAPAKGCYGRIMCPPAP